jgi:UDP-glucose 4-epimerase
VRVVARHPVSGDLGRILTGAEVLLGSAGEESVLAAALDGVDHVVHALGCPFPAESAMDPAGDLAHTIPGLVKLLDILRWRPGVRLTFVSSGGTVYGNTGTSPIDEDSQTNPVTAYGITKLTAERFIRMYSELYGVRANILRVANAYGPRQTTDRGQGVVAAFIAAAVTSAPIQIFGDGSLVRDYVHVEDIAAAVRGLYELDLPTTIINVGSGRGHTLTEVLTTVQEIRGSNLCIERLPPRDFDARHVVLDITRLRSLIAWSPLDLDEGIKGIYAEWERIRDVPTDVPDLL